MQKTSSRARGTSRRVRTLKKGTPGSGPVLYWMSRDQRAKDNWALLHAQKQALRRQCPLVVVFCLAPAFLGAARWQYDFTLRGLLEVEASLARKNISFIVLEGDPGEEVGRFAAWADAAEIITDFDPLRIKKGWKEAVASRTLLPIREVDAHNVIPAWVASDKQEYAARTFRPKVHRLLPEYLEDIPALKKHSHTWRKETTAPDWKRLRRTLPGQDHPPPVTAPVPGERAAAAALRAFVKKKLDAYDRDSNDPVKRGQSELSPYLHFGQLSAQRVALAARSSAADTSSLEAFLEELIVRRELADNFCLYQEQYDSVAGFPSWSQKTLKAHRRDKRSYIYSLADLEKANTHDPLWNAAQTQMVRYGTMHGYMRMYWGKQILAWSRSPEMAMAVAIELNDRYQLDGRDPNGYTGIAWCVGGVHDRPWPERPVFGTVRTMTFEGCRRKFDVQAYIDRVETGG